MADRAELPKNAELASRVLDAQSKERGMLGHLFGTKEHAPTNIAAMALVLLIILLTAVLFAPMQEDVHRGAIVTALLSAITFTLGLIFGRSSAGE